MSDENEVGSHPADGAMTTAEAVPPLVVGELVLTTESTIPQEMLDPVPLVEQINAAGGIAVTEESPPQERVLRKLDRDLERQLEVLQRRRNQVLGQALEISKLDGGVNADEVRTIAFWLDQDFACLITALEYMPKPEKAA